MRFNLATIDEDEGPPGLWYPWSQHRDEGHPSLVTRLVPLSFLMAIAVSRSVALDPRTLVFPIESSPAINLR